jgi:hypothetical protein
METYETAMVLLLQWAIKLHLPKCDQNCNTAGYIFKFVGQLSTEVLEKFYNRYQKATANIFEDGIRFMAGTFGVVSSCSEIYSAGKWGLFTRRDG